MPVSLRTDYPLGTARGCTCYTCGADRQGEPVVDWHQFIEGEGVLRQCASCVIEAAGLLGMIHPESRDEAIASMHELQAAADEALAERDEARALVDQVLRYGEKHPAPTTAGDVPLSYEPTLPKVSEQVLDDAKPKRRSKATA